VTIWLLRFSGLNTIRVHEEKSDLFEIRINYDWVSVTPYQIARWDFPIVQRSIDIWVINTHVHE